jgi:menaquinone-dependent protoporphyrinogen oxidase
VDVAVARIVMPFWGEYGQTKRICERVRSVIAPSGHTAEIVPIQECRLGPNDCDAILIGASIRHGKHDPSVLQFILQHQPLLESTPSAFFSVSLIARKPTRNTPETNPYVKAFIARSPWKPSLVGVFGGELDYQRYGLFNRYVIRLIMKINRGPTDLNTKVEFTDWDAVTGFAGRFAALLDARSA